MNPYENPFDLARAAITAAQEAVGEALGESIWTKADVERFDDLFRVLRRDFDQVEESIYYTRADAEADKADGMYSAGEIGGRHGHHDIGGEG